MYNKGAADRKESLELFENGGVEGGGLEGDWAKLPSITFQPTNRICFCSVNQIGASSRCECESNSQFR